jgi:glycosyltransferase involved in cell wall biosynthesis
MKPSRTGIRVLYSFPHKLGADRICYTAWQQINGLAAAGAKILAFPAALHRPVPEGVEVRPTLARGRLRIPFRAIGSHRAFALHDYIVSQRLESLRDAVDIIHAWPQGALRTLGTAKRLGIPVVLERANAHTRFAYEVVRDECERIGVALPSDHEHAHNEDVLRVEEAEFRAADRLLCPSEFVAKTFLERGFPPSQLARHIYGFDENTYFPDPQWSPDDDAGLKMLFVGVCAVRKGVHFALEAWLRSSAHRSGTFSIAGEFLPAYASKLAGMLSHPSVRVLGHRKDVPALMRQSDLLVLPSIEEGFGLVCTEAMGSGCVPLVSDACTDLCRHQENALVHRVGDVESLSQHITLMHKDRAVLRSLRQSGLGLAPCITWTAAGSSLLDVYAKIIEDYRASRSLPTTRRDAANVTSHVAP